eukprot:4119364-Karenia_brevis.AAC.1
MAGPAKLQNFKLNLLGDEEKEAIKKLHSMLMDDDLPDTPVVRKKFQVKQELGVKKEPGVKQEPGVKEEPADGICRGTKAII